MSHELKTTPYSILPTCPRCKQGPILDGFILCPVCESKPVTNLIEDIINNIEDNVEIDESK